MANTTPQEITLILQTIVKPNYTNALVDNYYSTITLLPVVPASNPDRLMQFITELILYTRNPALGAYNSEMSDADKLDFYQDLQRGLATAITALTAVKTPIDTEVTTLLD